MSSFVVSEEKNQNTLILIIDKRGIFAKDLAKEIDENITTVLVSEKSGFDEKNAERENRIVIPYDKAIPEIPDGNYSHMIFVWDGKEENLHVLVPLLQKAELDKSHFLFVTDYHFFSESIFKEINSRYSKASMVLVGDVFGQSKYESIVTRFFREAQSGSIWLDNVGLKHVYPVLFYDVVKEIIKLSFGTNREKIYLAFKRFGITQLHLAHTLQKIDPLLKIDFKKEEKKEPGPEAHQPLAEEGEYLFDYRYDVERKLQEAYTDLKLSDKTMGKNIGNLFFSPFAIKKEKEKNRKTKNRWKIVLFLVIFLISFPTLLTIFYAGLGGLELYASTASLKIGNFKEAQSFSQGSKSFFSVAGSAQNISGKEMQLIFLGKIDYIVANSIKEGSLYASLLYDVSKAGLNFSSVENGNSLSPQADFLTGINSLKDAFILLEAKDQSLFSALQPVSNILDVVPFLFGFPDKKTYLVLLQNNMELRPAGGFIGSFALVTLDRGKVSDFSIHDVYDADGQLKGHVEPPFVIRRYIPTQHWYLRDSNFDVDFSQDSANAAFFLAQEIGQKVDGIIGVDLSFVKGALGVLGPVYVPEYNVTVNADNFFLMTESFAEKNTFAGSTQKRDFLSALFSAIQRKIGNTHGFSLKALSGLISTLKTKDVVFGFSDPLLQDIFTINGLSSTLWDGRTQDLTSINDITAINEANIGVNKANYFITRKAQEQITIDNSGSISGKLIINYKNNSQKGVWPGGPYKNYLRVILPGGSKISAVSINGVQQTIVPAVTDFNVYESPSFTAPSGLEVDSVSEEGKQIYGFVTTIPEQSTQKIEIIYIESQKIDTNKPTFIYNGWLFKQPGVDAYPYSFSLSYPDFYAPLKKDFISFKENFKEDKQFSVEFAHK